MTARVCIYGIALGVSAATAIFAARAAKTHRTQRLDLAHIREKVERSQELTAENLALRQRLMSADRADRLSADHAKLASLRQRLDQARTALRRLQRAAGEKPEPVWPEGADVLLAAQWENVGASSPQNAMQSFLGAVRDGDIDRVSKLITLQPLTQADAASAFAQLPSATQAQFTTPEKMIATYVAAKIPDYAATAEVQPMQTYGTTAIARYRMADTAGDQQDLTLLFQKSSDGNWQLAVPRASVAQYLTDLQSHSTPK